MAPLDIPREIARLRGQFADQMELLDEAAWHTASWCSGWQVRDVLAHLVWAAESTYLSLAGDLLRGGLRPDRTVAKAARRLILVPVPDLCSRLRAAEEGARLPGFPEAIGLGDVLVHTADAFRPLGMEVNAPPEDVGCAFDAFWHRGRTIVHAEPQRGRSLMATDVHWHQGTGPEIRGTALDPLLFIANRRQVISELEGPGLDGL